MRRRRATPSTTCTITPILMHVSRSVRPTLLLLLNLRRGVVRLLLRRRIVLLVAAVAVVVVLLSVFTDGTVDRTVFDCVA